VRNLHAHSDPAQYSTVVIDGEAAHAAPRGELPVSRARHGDYARRVGPQRPQLARAVDAS
jgi:hypothetical protein